MNPLALELSDVSVRRGGPDPVVRDLTLSLPMGGRLALLGANGAGKTSLLLAIVGAAEHTGRLALCGEPLTSGDVDFARRHAGLLFSEPADQLFCATAFDEVAFGARQRGLSEAAVDTCVRRQLELAGLVGFEQRRPAALSLGEQRRLALAAVLACQPAIVLCDEPTAALDPVARKRMLAALGDLDATIVLATHDLDAALSLGGSALLLKRGAPVAFGPTDQILADESLLREAGLAE